MDLKMKSGGVTERSSKLVSLLERDTLQEASTRQQTDHLIELATGDSRVEEAEMNVFQGTMLFTAKDLRRLLEGKNIEHDKKVELHD